MRMTFHVRSETPSDHAAIEAVTKAAFVAAPHTDHNEQFIVAALRAAGALTLSLVAEMNAAVIAHVAVSPVQISDGTEGWFGLGPISVMPALQGRGIGSSLMHEALQRLAAQGASGCVVLGEPAYYRRFGFDNDPGLVLPQVPAEYFMALPFGTRRPRGVVTYHPAFSARH